MESIHENERISTHQECMDEIFEEEMIAENMFLGLDVDDADLGRSLDDDSIRYWIYEIYMSEGKRAEFDQVLKELGQTPEEFVTEAVVEKMRESGDATERRHEERLKRSMTLPDILLVRYYPVHVNVTEEQARKRRLEEENRGVARRSEEKRGDIHVLSI